MLPRFHWADITTVAHYLGVLIIMMGAFMLLPAAVALACDEGTSLSAFVFAAGLCFAIGALLRLFKAQRLVQRRALLLMGMAWVALPVLASIPLWLSGDFVGYADALFDAVSSFTTTGATLAYDVDHISASQAVWRTLLTMAGGFLLVFMALFFRFFGVGGEALAAHKRGEVAKVGRSNARQVALSILGASAFFLVIGIVALFVLGIMAGDDPAAALVAGFCLIGNALNTGGFSGSTSGLIYYHSVAVQAVVAVFMILGATNFAVFAVAMRGEFATLRKNAELKLFIAWLVIVCAFVTASLTRTGEYTTLAGLFSNGTFTAISAVTTGGMQTVYPEQYGLSLDQNVLIILSIALLFGACSHSTGGGIKMVRIVMVLRWVVYSIKCAVLPRNAHVRVKIQHFGYKTLDSRMAMQAMTVFILYVIGGALGSMLFIAHGDDPVQSIFEAVSFVSNGGVSAGLSSAAMSFDLKVAAILLMLAGRVEFIILFATVAGILISLKSENLTQGGRERELRAHKASKRGGSAWRKRKLQKLLGASDAGPKALSIAVLLVSGTLALALCAAPFAQAAGTGGLSAGQVSADEVSSLADTSTYREMEIADLLVSTSRFEGRGVQITGEVIGVPRKADEGHKWINLKRGGKMIGVYVTDEQAAVATAYGMYGQVGDTLTVRGNFNVACASHAGEMEVHAVDVTLEQPGRAVEHSLDRDLLVAGAALAVLGVLLSLLRRWVYRRLNIRSSVLLWR